MIWMAAPCPATRAMFFSGRLIGWRTRASAAAAFELEFFLLDNERDANGAVRPASDVLDGRARLATDVYSMEKLQGMLPLFNEIYAAAEAAAIPIENMISEYAPANTSSRCIIATMSCRLRPT